MMVSNNSTLLDRTIEVSEVLTRVGSKNEASAPLKSIKERDKLSHLVPAWEKSCTNTESTLHQLSPYIGKLKSSIAHDLILNYSPPRGLVADVFAGSGTVLLEAVRLGRRAFGVDSSPYAALLSRAKLSAPNTLDEALIRAKRRLEAAASRPSPDRRKIPSWVRNFFHPDTLGEVINFAKECQEQDDDFLLACMLGILHHQRPGFLSHPSSHLTPYLRDKKFPRDEFPQLYQYRALAPRLVAKVERTYKRKDFIVSSENHSFIEGATESISFPSGIDCLITSPPYMNALDYGRDNRLRLWFIDKAKAALIDNAQSQQRDGFQTLMAILARQAAINLVPNGYCIVIVGDQIKRGAKYPLSIAVQETFSTHAPELHLSQTIVNNIPDIRRARREHRGVRTENFLIFKKKNA
ncbi:MAG: DNA methyltransferase [Sulfuricella sp.]|nr:DNA methyltransferase [Sulfuricella sp.]